MTSSERVTVIATSLNPPDGDSNLPEKADHAFFYQTEEEIDLNVRNMRNPRLPANYSDRIHNITLRLNRLHFLGIENLHEQLDRFSLPLLPFVNTRLEAALLLEWRLLFHPSLKNELFSRSDGLQALGCTFDLTADQELIELGDLDNRLHEMLLAFPAETYPPRVIISDIVLYTGLPYEYVQLLLERLRECEKVQSEQDEDPVIYIPTE